MLWSRRVFLGAALWGLAACGYTPVNTGSDSLIGVVSVQAPDQRESFLLVQRLEERLGRSVDPRYELAFTLDLSEEGLAEDASGQIRRFNILGKAVFTLRDINTGTVATSGQVDNFTGYGSATTAVAALAARNDAMERLMTILADQIVTQLQLVPPR